MATIAEKSILFTRPDYTFRCHRAGEKLQQKKDGSTAHIFAVNALAFHPFHTMSCLSAGADGVFTMWDIQNKKLLKSTSSSQMYSVDNVEAGCFAQTTI